MRSASMLLTLGLALVAVHAPSAPTEASPPAAPAPGPHPPMSLDTCGAPSMPAARIKARALVEQIRDELAAVEDEIRSVPFIPAIEAGTVSIEGIAAVVAEEYGIISSDLSSFTIMADRWDGPGSHFFGDLAYGESLAQPLVLDFAATVGLDEQDLVEYEPRPAAQTYPSRVAWIANNADRASAAASFLVNFDVFGENMARIRDALITVYGFEADEIAFFSFFAEPIPGFEDDAIEVIATGLHEGACPRDVRRSARLLQAYELDFWQAASEPPGSPLPVVW
ncbi:MAG: transcriptional regulator [Myxococcales bacterium]|nr:hypothetical protein [Myxococcales bacterium]MCB9718620.1 transcriptional regulator [Myxococcales bacterium]